MIQNNGSSHETDKIVLKKNHSAGKGQPMMYKSLRFSMKDLIVATRADLLKNILPL